MDRNEKIKALLEDPERKNRLLGDSQKLVPFILLGHATATASADKALLKLEVLVQEQEPRLAIFPLVLSRAQCTELGEALSRLASATHTPAGNIKPS